MILLVIRLKISIEVISDLNKLDKIEHKWNMLISSCSKNPFLLSGFIKQFMKFNTSKGWTPLVLTISVDNKIVGISPLKIKRIIGIRFAKFLSTAWFLPDFVSNDQFREICLSHTLIFLFRILRCQIVDLTLPADSSSLRIIKQECESSRIRFYIRREMGRRILPVRCTWSEFRASRSGDFRRKFKRLEQNLDRLGLWKITCTESGKGEFDAIQKILDVEKKSWKEEVRARSGMKADLDLLMIWSGAKYMAELDPHFTWSAKFLELNNQELAHVLILQYKDVAYLVKTSYDRKYEKSSPGIFLVNTAIHELFNMNQVRRIDFLTDLRFMETWTSLCLPRIRIVMLRRSVPSIIMQLMRFGKHSKGIVSLLSKRIPSITDLIGA
jgi:hypothetical protein